MVYRYLLNVIIILDLALHKTEFYYYIYYSFSSLVARDGPHKDVGLCAAATRRRSIATETRDARRLHNDPRLDREHEKSVRRKEAPPGGTTSAGHEKPPENGRTHLRIFDRQTCQSSPFWWGIPAFYQMSR